MSKPLVYLAGPIKGLDYTGAVAWRVAFEQLVSEHIKCLSPMRFKSYLAREELIGDDYPEHVLSTSRGIVTRDFFDCNRADMVVANLLGAERVSIGTVLEIGWAHAARVPLVVVMEPRGNVHDHGMIRECIGFRVPSLDEAADVVRAVLLP